MMTLEEEIAALNNEIARWNTEYYAAKANGDKQMQISLLATITTRGNNLDKLLDRQEREARRLDQQIHHSQPHAQLAHPHQQSGTFTLLIIFFVHDFHLSHYFSFCVTLSLFLSHFVSSYFSAFLISTG
jgi:hypothetical protein